MAQDAIGLTLDDSDDESPAAAAAREAAQRQQIMAFARAKARERAEPAPESQAQQASQPPPAAAGTVPRQGSVQTELAAEAAVQPAQGAAASTTFSNSDLKALHEARMRRLRAQAAGQGSSSGSSGGDPQQSGSSRQALQGLLRQAGTTGNSRSPVSLLTYNVWFREDVALQQRMQGIADIIAAAGYPTFICLQEMTPNILRICSTMPWWQRYTCSPASAVYPYFTLLCVNKAAAPSVSSSDFEEVHFDNSCMGRSLKVVLATVGGRKVLVANTHLESPMPPDAWFSKERQQQMRFSLAQLQKAPYANVLFAGDMNWEDGREGQPQLPEGWSDAWLALAHHGDPGYTFDAKNNPMLPHSRTPPLRLDRIFARLSDFRLASVSILGKEQLGDATYTHTFRSGGSKELPVLPSDHFGLLLKLEAK